MYYPSSVLIDLYAFVNHKLLKISSFYNGVYIVDPLESHCMHFLVGFIIHTTFIKTIYSFSRRSCTTRITSHSHWDDLHDVGVHWTQSQRTLQFPQNSQLHNNKKVIQLCNKQSNEFPAQKLLKSLLNQYSVLNTVQDKMFQNSQERNAIFFSCI